MHQSRNVLEADTVCAVIPHIQPHNKVVIMVHHKDKANTDLEANSLSMSSNRYLTRVLPLEAWDAARRAAVGSACENATALERSCS
jgi:hypothetical protein